MREISIQVAIYINKKDYYLNIIGNNDLIDYL